MSNKNMYTDGTYLVNNPGWNAEDSGWKAGFILKLMNSNNIAPGEITEVGCGAGGILTYLSKTNPHKIKYAGYDISPQAIALAKTKENEQLHFYHEDFLNTTIHTDLLLVIDVVEHIEDYYGFLQKLKPKSNNFIFHIPLDLAFISMFKPHILHQQREKAGHIHYFTREMVEWFLQDAGFEIMDWFYTKPVIDELRPENGFKRTLKRIIRNTTFRINKDISAKLWGSYSMMILAK